MTGIADELRQIPLALREVPQWVLWRYETRDGKATKVPYSARDGAPASATASSTWSTFEVAVAARTSRPHFDGIGFVFSSADPFCGIDLDDCIADDGTLLPWARRIVEEIDTYTEVSPSGRGVKLFLRGTLPAGRRRKGKIELYDAGRYFTVTDQRLDGSPSTVEERQTQLERVYRQVFGTVDDGLRRSPTPPDPDALEPDDERLLAKARAARNGEKFVALYDRGDLSAYGNDDSRGDFALCLHLAFWCGRESARIDRLFRRSALMRPKWDSRRANSTYGAQTIGRALEVALEVHGSGLHDAPGTPASRPPGQAQILVGLASDVALLHTADELAYVGLDLDGHHETWPLRSSRFRQLLIHRFFSREGKPPGAQAVQDALGVLEARARFEGPEVAVRLRLAEHDGAVYLDLANPGWECVEISPEGWTVRSAAPVRFRRSAGLLPLPRPVPGGSLADLRRFVNVPDDLSFCLVAGWLVGALRPTGPFALLILQGEQGSAKSTCARMLRALVDPSASPVRSLVREERDLMIAARNGWLLAFDNLSGIPTSLSDAFCRLATGGGFSTRALYTDDEEVIFDAQRPVILNGIEDLADRLDLGDRSLVVTLPSIPPDSRRTERELWAAFEEARPRLLGALCDAVSAVLRNLATVRLPAAPRMADFAQWVVAAEPALPWPQGEFLRAYTGNRDEVVELALENDPVAAAVRSLTDEGSPWTGTATALLADLDRRVSESTRESRSWPKAPNRLTGRLRRAATALRAVGIEVEFLKERGPGSRRLVSLRTTPPSTDATDAIDAGSAQVARQLRFEEATVGPVGVSIPATVARRFGSLETPEGDAGDGRVDLVRPSSGASGLGARFGGAR